MFDKLSAAPKKVIRHIHRNRAKYAAGSTAAAFTYIAVKRAEDWNDFLEEHNLLDAYYNPEV